MPRGIFERTEKEKERLRKMMSKYRGCRKGAKLPKEETERRTKSRRKNGWFKDPKQASKNQSEAHKGKVTGWNHTGIHPHKGKKFSKETREKQSKSHKERYKKQPMTQETIKKIVETRKKNNSYITKESTKKKIASTLKGQFAGEKHHNFQGWKSREPYGKDWSPKLREYIRKFYHYRCQQCFRHQDELDRKLHIHHIDFNKQNNHPSNLIPLCNNCHSQTQFNREDWIKYFQNKVALQ